MTGLRIRSIWLVAALALVLSAVAVACGGDDPTPTPVPPTATTPPIATPTTAPPGVTPPAATATPTPTPGPTAFDLLLEEARQELAADPVLAIGFSLREPIPELLAERFNARFGTNMRLEGVGVSSTEAVTRALVAYQAGQPAEDVFRTSIEVMSNVVDTGLAEQVDWVGIFGDEFPLIAEAAMMLIPEYQGYALHFNDQFRQSGYRTDLIDFDDLPKTWDEVLDPKHKGNFVVDGRGYPIHYLLWLPDWDRDRVLAYARGLLENDALVVSRCRGNELISGEVAFTLACGSLTQESKDDPSLPVDQYLIGPQNPTSWVNVFVPANAGHPNASKLFAAWNVSEAMDIWEEHNARTREGVPGSSYVQEVLTDKNPLNTTLVAPETIEQAEEANVLRKEVAEILTGVR